MKDKIIEAIYYNIGSQYVESANKRLNDVNDGIEYPEKLNIWFNNYIDTLKKEERKQKRKKIIYSTMKKVAIFFIVFSIGLTSIMIGSEAFRIKLLNFITNIKESHTEIQVVDSNDIEIPIDWTYYYYPEYLPKGYELKVANEYGTNRILVFVNLDNDEIIFSQSPNTGKYQMDTEDAIVEELFINGCKGIYVEKNEVKTLIWYDDNTIYNISGKAKKEDIIKMADSLSIIK